MDTTPLKQKADKCIKSQNFELAQKIYLQIMQVDPKDVETRQHFRAVSLKLFEEKKKKSSALKNVQLNLSLTLAGKNHQKIINIADQILANDPNNSKLLVKQGLSALELKHIDVATFILESAAATDTKALEPLKVLADLYSKKKGRENLKKATQYAQRMLEIEPRNKDIQDFCRKLDAELAQMPFEKGSFLEGLSDKKETEEREKEEQLIHSDADAEHAIKMLNKKGEEDPNNPKTFEKLGDVLLRLRRTKEAKEAYNKALALNPANSIIQVKLGDIDINEYVWKIQKIKETLEKNPENSTELKAELHKLEVEKYKASVIEYEKRVEQQPTVNLFKYNLAKLYYQDKKKANDAIRLFQITCKEPTYRTDSLVYLGKLFAINADYDLAIKQYIEALKTMAGFDSRKKDTLYSKADALEKLGNLAESLQTFQSILIEDIGYRDVSKRVDALKEKQK